MGVIVMKGGVVLPPLNKTAVRWHEQKQFGKNATKRKLPKHTARL